MVLSHKKNWFLIVDYLAYISWCSDIKMEGLESEPKVGSQRAY